MTPADPFHDPRNRHGQISLDLTHAGSVDHRWVAEGADGSGAGRGGLDELGHQLLQQSDHTRRAGHHDVSARPQLLGRLVAVAADQ